MNALDPVMRVSDQIGEAIRLHEPEIDGRGGRGADRGALRLRRASTRPAPRQYPHEFSGGMRQRVMIALALACKPGADHRRRADHRARRDDAGADPGAARGAAARPRAGDDPDHPRPLGAGRDLRPGGDHVRRSDRRDRGRSGRSTRSPQHPYTQRLLGAFPTVGGPARAGAARSPAFRPTRPRCPAAAASSRAATSKAQDAQVDRASVGATGALPVRTLAGRRAHCARCPFAPREPDGRPRPSAGRSATPLFEARDLEVHFPARRAEAGGPGDRRRRPRLAPRRGARHRRRVGLRQVDPRPGAARAGAADRRRGRCSTGSRCRAPTCASCAVASRWCSRIPTSRSTRA